MALNLHTDLQFERRLAWLSRRLKKTETDMIQNLVLEKYNLQKSGFHFGALKPAKNPSSRTTQKQLKALDQDASPVGAQLLLESKTIYP